MNGDGDIKIALQDGKAISATDADKVKFLGIFFESLAPEGLQSTK